MNATVAESIPMSRGITGLLTALSGGARDTDACLFLTARSESGFGDDTQHLRVGPRGQDIDAPLFDLIRMHWAAHVGLAVRDVLGHNLIRLHALAATWVAPTIVRHAEAAVPQEALAEALTRISKFAVQPTITIIGGRPIGGGGFTVTAVYRLDQPLAVRDAVGATRALELLRRLARALGATSLSDAVTLADLVVPLPGSRVRELLTQQLEVQTLSLHEDRVYPLARFDAALAKESHR